MRRGATVLLTYGGRDGRWRVGDGGVAQVRHDVGEGSFRGFPNDGKCTHGGGALRGNFLGCWLGMRGIVPVQR
jgi:hypothetical protein